MTRYIAGFASCVAFAAVAGYAPASAQPEREASAPRIAPELDAIIDGDCLTIGEAIVTAVERDPRIAVARAEVDAARALLEREKSSGRPQVSLFARAGANEGGQLLNSQFDNEAGVQARQTLFDFGRLSAAKSAARSEIAAADFGRELARRDTIIQTVSAYLDLARASQVVRIADEQVKVFADDAAIAQRSLEEGLITGAAASQMIAGSAIAQSRRSNARIEQLSAAENLSAYVGSIPACVTALDELMPTFEDPVLFSGSGEALLERLENSAIDLRRQEALVLAQEARLRGAKRLWRPNVDVTAFYAQRYDDIQDNFNERGRIGLTLTIPFYQGGLVSAETDLQEARLAAEQARLEDKRRELRREVSRAFNSIPQQLDALDNTQSATEALERQLAFARRGYETNLGLFSDVSRAADDLFRNSISEVELRYALLQNKTFILALLEELDLPETEREWSDGDTYGPRD